MKRVETCYVTMNGQRLDKRLVVFVLERNLDAKQQGDLIARDEQQLAGEVRQRGLARQCVHVRIELALPEEHGHKLRDQERNGDLCMP